MRILKKSQRGLHFKEQTKKGTNFQGQRRALKELGNALSILNDAGWAGYLGQKVEAFREQIEREAMEKHRKECGRIMALRKKQEARTHFVIVWALLPSVCDLITDKMQRGEW